MCTFIYYHHLLLVSTEVPQAPAQFCASKNGPNKQRFDNQPVLYVQQFTG